jgi:hypothetical protein
LRATGLRLLKWYPTTAAPLVIPAKAGIQCRGVQAYDDQQGGVEKPKSLDSRFRRNDEQKNRHPACEAPKTALTHASAATISTADALQQIAG